MSQNITEYVKQLISKLTGDKSLLDKFVKDPAKTVSDVLGVKLDADMLQNVIQAVQAKLNLEDVAKSAGGLLDKIKGLFGK